MQTKRQHSQRECSAPVSKKAKPSHDLEEERIEQERLEHNRRCKQELHRDLRALFQPDMCGNIPFDTLGFGPIWEKEYGFKTPQPKKQNREERKEKEEEDEPSFVREYHKKQHSKIHTMPQHNPPQTEKEHDALEELGDAAQPANCLSPSRG